MLDEQIDYHLLCVCVYLSVPGSSQSFENMNPGLNRPIPRSDMRTIESQLARHQLTEQTASARRQEREDLLRADPWTHPLSNRGITESMASSQDEFQSLDLNSSFAGSTMTQSLGLDDSFVSTDSKKIPSRRQVPGKYGEFCEASASKQQQASSRSSRGEKGVTTDPVSKESDGDLCRYSFSLGGVTVALLETRPAYMYPTAGAERSFSSEGCATSDGSEGCASSVDEGGLDPGRYLQAVCSLLADGVNRRELERKGEELAQALPNDHLLCVVNY